jgi:hydroxypyruvate reductase
LTGSGERRALLVDLFEQACRAASPAAVMPATIPVAAHGRTLVIAIGKAAGEMMRVARQRAGLPLEGLVVTRYDHLPGEEIDWSGVEIIEAGHPVPDENSVRGARRALELAYELRAGDRLIVLLSGGGSALAAAPAFGVTLEDKQTVTRALLRCSATIQDINIVRKHLSAIKGGRLAVAAGPAAVTTWIISDVPGDDADLVASGPTVADSTTLEAARSVLARHGIDPPSGIAHALEDPANETPPSDSSGLSGAETLVLGGAKTALAAAARRAADQAIAVTDLGDRLQGEARALGACHADLARQLGGDNQRRLILSGGETTVTVANPDGRGGPNLEYLLGLALALDGAAGISAIACDTDGIDGTSDAAGALIFPDTLARGRALGLDAAEHLSVNRTHIYFAALGDLVVTGPTLTNVMDFRAILIE